MIAGLSDTYQVQMNGATGNSDAIENGLSDQSTMGNSYQIELNPVRMASFQLGSKAMAFFGLLVVLIVVIIIIILVNFI